jgi:hypothetical protein
MCGKRWRWVGTVDPSIGHFCNVSLSIVCICNEQAPSAFVGLVDHNLRARSVQDTGCSGSYWERLICRHCGNPWQTEGHSFGSHPIQWVSQCYTVDCYRSVILLCSVLCLWLVWDTFKNKGFSFMIVMSKKDSYNRAGENFALNFPSQHVHLEIQFPKWWRKLELTAFELAESHWKGIVF